MAEELDITVLCLSQVSHKTLTYKRNIKLHHLKGFNNIGRNSDMVWYLNRPDKGTTASLTVLKNKNGNCGIVPLEFCAEYTLFKDVKQEK
jgi:replicative DNA helicase